MAPEQLLLFLGNCLLFSVNITYTQGMILRTMPQVMVLSSEGYFYSYSIDLENGGECTLLKQYSLLDSGDESLGNGD